MDNYELWFVIQDNFNALNKELKDYVKSGYEYAQKNAEYYRIKNLRTIQLQAEKYTATAIQLLIKGDKQVNQALLERDCAETLYKASQERINAIKLQIKIYEAQLEREWGNT